MPLLLPVLVPGWATPWGRSIHGGVDGLDRVAIVKQTCGMSTRDELAALVKKSGGNPWYAADLILEHMAPSEADRVELERWADDHFSQGEVAVVMRLADEFGWRPPAQ